MTIGPWGRTRPGGPEPCVVGSAAQSAAVVELAVLTMEVLQEWFRTRAVIVRADPSKLAITTLTEACGAVTCLQGIFDTDARSFSSGDVRRVRAREIEQAVRDAHAGREITIWG